MSGGKFKELLKKYGKVAVGVHIAVSAVSFTGIYIAVKNNVDVESMLGKYGSMLENYGMPNPLKKKDTETTNLPSGNQDTAILLDSMSDVDVKVEKEKNRTAELVGSSGGALAVALLLNKALFPVKIPITMVLTPPVARFLARRNLIKNL